MPESPEETLRRSNEHQTRLVAAGWGWEAPSEECQLQLAPPLILIERVVVEDRAGVLWRLATLVLFTRFNEGDVAKLDETDMKLAESAAQFHLTHWLGSRFGLEFEEHLDAQIKLRDDLHQWGEQRLTPSMAQWYKSLEETGELFDSPEFEPGMTTAMLDVWSRAVPVAQHKAALERGEQLHRIARGDHTGDNKSEHFGPVTEDELLAHLELLRDAGSNTYLRNGKILLSHRTIRNQLNSIFGAGVTAPQRLKTEALENAADPEWRDAEMDSAIDDALRLLGVQDELRELEELDALRALEERIAAVGTSEGAAVIAAKFVRLLGVSRAVAAEKFGTTIEKIRWAERSLPS